MKSLILVSILFFSSFGFSAVFDCENEVREGERQVTATYQEEVIGDILTVRLLKNIEVNTEGEVMLSESFFFGKLLRGKPVNAGEGMEFQVLTDHL